MSKQLNPGDAQPKSVSNNLVQAAEERGQNSNLTDETAQSLEAPNRLPHKWTLNVQGVHLDVDTPTIMVRDALSQAGFDPNQGWLIFLKVSGKPKEAVELSTTIDLTRPGIEKLRLTPREVNNGEAAPAPRRAFALLDVDEEYLQWLSQAWETVIDDKRRWLLIHDYRLPEGYIADRTTLALEIPSTYPGAQIDMFYAYPPANLASGRTIDRTQVRAVIEGCEYHGWSRHRGPASPWNPTTDNVITHLALVESALAKEVGL